MDMANVMGSMNKSVYEQQISSLYEKGKIDENQADYMQEYLNKLRR